MKKIESLKIKQMQNNKLRKVIQDDKLFFLENNIKYVGLESCIFIGEYLDSNKLDFLNSLKTNDLILVKNEILNKIKLLNEDEFYYFNFGNYSNFSKDGEWYNVPSLPVFNLKSNEIEMVLDQFLKKDITFILIASDAFLLLVDSSVGDTSLENPDIPLYELYFK